MAIYMVTYDLRAPGRNYQPVYDYLQTFTYCKGMESVWLIDTLLNAAQIRDELNKRIDSNDRSFIARLQGDWASWNYTCADWLNKPERRW